jgi:hypothetical protein
MSKKDVCAGVGRSKTKTEGWDVGTVVAPFQTHP